MSHHLYKYRFPSEVSIDEVEASLVLAIMATESLHGVEQVRLDTAHYLDRGQRACVIDASTAVGRDINRLLVGFLRREFGDDQFSVERVETAATGGVDLDHPS